jgi:hypothetical protein
MEPRSHTHDCYVQTIQGDAEDEPRGFFAVCPTCGSDRFPDRLERSEAEEDGRQHRELLEPVPGQEELGL